MKCLMVLVLGVCWVGTAWSDGRPDPSVSLTPLEQSLSLARSFLRTDDQGHGYLLVQGEPLSQGRLRSLSPWDLMVLVQKLSAVSVPLSRFGDNDDLTQAWRDKVVAFAASADAPPRKAPENLFDPDLVLWDPGYIQKKNEWGQWSIHLDNRDIVQADLPHLSPLEVQQAVLVLTGRSYPLDFILDHLEEFRGQLSIDPRAR